MQTEETEYYYFKYFLCLSLSYNCSMKWNKTQYQHYISNIGWPALCITIDHVESDQKPLLVDCYFKLKIPCTFQMNLWSFSPASSLISWKFASFLFFFVFLPHGLHLWEPLFLFYFFLFRYEVIINSNFFNMHSWRLILSTASRK